MHTNFERLAETPGAPASTPAEMRKLILKLRWIGMEDEAQRLSTALALCAPADCVPMDPRDTD